MKNKKGPAAVSPANKAKVSAAQQGAVTDNSKHHDGEKRKLSPVPIDVAFAKVPPDSQIAKVMACLSGSAQFIPMPALSQRSGSLTVHSAVASIRRRFRWVIGNKMERFGLEWHSSYRLVDPQPQSAV